MHVSSTPTQPVTTRLHGRWLFLARAGGIVLIGLTLVAFFIMLPAYSNYLHNLCLGPGCKPEQHMFALAATLKPRNSNSYIDIYMIYTLTFTFISLLVCLVTAALLFWRRSDDWMALLAALMLVQMATGLVTYLLMQQTTPWQVPALFLNIVAFTGLFLVFALFPNGRFVPGWIGWLPIIWFAWGMIVLVWHNHPMVARVHNLVWGCSLLILMLAQIYRYRTVSNPLQRQQTKWVIWGTSIAIIIAMAFDLPQVFIAGLVQQNIVYQLLNAPADALALFLASFSIGMAVLRSRLWEIDRLINRTIVYSLLTVLLALFYLGLIIMLQTLVSPFGGQVLQSPIMIVLSTLAIAALFQPLRLRLQKVIDRHFYRRMYDANQALITFGKRLHSEFDLEQLCEQVVVLVSETMEPAHISLWLVRPVDLEAQTTQPLPLLSENRTE